MNSSEFLSYKISEALEHYGIKGRVEVVERAETFHDTVNLDVILSRKLRRSNIIDDTHAMLRDIILNFENSGYVKDLRKEYESKIAELEEKLDAVKLKGADKLSEL